MPSDVPPDALIVLSTFPNQELARSCGEMLVREKLAACVSLIPQIESLYEWEGAFERNAEILALIKTDRARYPALERRLQEQHPYEVPEILALPVVQGFPPYLAWLNQCLALSPDSSVPGFP